LVPCVGHDGARWLWSCAVAMMKAFWRDERACCSVWRGTRIEGGELIFKARQANTKRYTGHGNEGRGTYRSPWFPTWWAIDGARKRFLVCFWLVQLSEQAWDSLCRRKGQRKSWQAKAVVCAKWTSKWGLWRGLSVGMGQSFTGPLRGFACQCSNPEH
jgi:hypothetical protein